VIADEKQVRFEGPISVLGNRHQDFLAGKQSVRVQAETSDMNLSAAQCKAWWVSLLTLSLWLLASATALTAEDLSDSSTSRESRAEAVAAIPFQQLNQATQQKLGPILDRPHLYRRLPVETIHCDHDMHTFMIRKPEVIVGIWQLMGITQVSMQRTGEYQLDTSDGAGTNSQLELVYGTPNLHVYYGQGLYEGNMLTSKVRGECVLILQSDLAFDQAGLPVVTDRLDVFLQFDQVGARLLAKTLHPLVGKAADHNFVESARFFDRISDVAQTNPDGFQNMVSRLPNCDPEVIQQFMQVSSKASQRYAVLPQNRR
jgi:hypothetical protein